MHLAQVKLSLWKNAVTWFSTATDNWSILLKKESESNISLEWVPVFEEKKSDWCLYL